MKKYYFFYLVLAFLFLTAQNGFSQDATFGTPNKYSIEGLSVFPNPVSNSKSVVFITTKSKALKRVEIYDVLGKKITAAVSTKKELDISSLTSGVYILKITENSISETRKLVIR
ncbi:T9SS type A sorting domain-containing protein [Algibacter sp. 2305UL17-15]|uniref:T9SS type A sorting domain-containing protein n=1 Tax=Algibacter sp. 2305UL17-15 TaxID=3231268 RepID=UPI00345A00B6